jgi:hypothetical protein
VRRIRFILLFAACCLLAGPASAQTPAFRVGERLSYTVSFERFPNIAYMETAVVSRGIISGREVVELQGRVKTFEFVSATISLVDESRTVLVAPESGLPLLVNRTIRSTAVPRDVVSNYLATPTTNFELLSLIYRAREAGGSGSFPFSENGENYVATFQPATGKEAAARIRTDAGEFETSGASMQSTYLDGLGIRNFRIDFSSDQHRLPVRIRFDTTRGTFTALLTAVRLDEPPTPAADGPPVVQPTPRPVATPRPLPTATPYVENQPLLRELKFVLGETLDYRVTRGGQPVGNVRLAAKERRQFQGLDSLLLSATVTQTLPGVNVFSMSDAAVTQVFPDTLAPQFAEFRFSQALAFANQRMAVNSASGGIAFNGGTVDAPVGTHSMLSLLYAMRSFNLQPSKATNNPVNDTRVAVFWKDKTYIFILRPSPPGDILMEGKKIPAQLISITTNVPELDMLQLRVWLSLDETRIPLRFAAGNYQMDLTTASVINP